MILFNPPLGHASPRIVTVIPWRNLWQQPRLWLATGGGLLLALAYAPAGVAGFAWIAPGLMVFAATGATGGTAFRLGYIAGFIYNLLSLCWLLLIPVNKLYPFMGWMALSAYLALYQAVWVWGCWRFWSTTAPDQNLNFNLHLQQFLSASRLRRAAWALGCAVLWVALEMAKARLLTGFPWSLLGVSQLGILPLIQIASVTGVYGISFLVAWLSLCLAMATTALAYRPAERTMAMGDLLPSAMVVFLVWLWGSFQMLEVQGKGENSARELKVALLQPSVPQTLIWNPSENAGRFDKLVRLSELAVAAKPDVLIWPEAAVPDMLRYDEQVWRAVTNLAMKHKVWMILGSDDAEPRPVSPPAPDYYNSAFLVSPHGQIVARYSKQHLVIFGEYVPLAKRLPFLKKFTPISGDFTPGPGPVPFEFVVENPASTNRPARRLPVKASVLICFEDILPQLVRDAVESDTDLLINLTNDGWFQESAAQWQHAANAAFRAVENRRVLIRCTNNGLTCWVDPYGRIRDILRDETQDIHGAGFTIVRIPESSLRRRDLTFYHRHGDWFGWGCVVLAGMLLLSRVQKLPLASRRRT